MLWYKSWLETRWRFFIGLGLFMLSAGGVVYVYPQVMKLIPRLGDLDTSGALGERIKDAVALQRDFRGYIWSQWVRQNLTQMGTLFAVILGSGGPYSQRSELFTLSLPVSRQRLVSVRAAAGLGELLVIIFVSFLLIPLFSPSVGQSYGVGTALVHALCAFVASAVFFSLAALLSTSFSDIWRPLLIACAAAIVLWIAGQIIRELSPYSIFTLMNGEKYFRSGQVPWVGLLAAASLSAAMLYAAVVNIERRDF
jgi:ABC-type transport system involved in multi-copper enzyme maturation permease subunit